MKIRFMFFLLGLSLLIIATAFGQTSRFKRYDFKVQGNIGNMFAEDFDNDGLLEVVVIHVDETKTPPKRFLSIYRQDKNGAFSDSRKLTWEFPPAVAAVDVGDISAEPGKELIFITEEGVFYAPVYETKIGALQKVMEVQSVVAIAYNRDVPYYNFVRDYTGDGKDDILICGFYNAVFARQEDNYTFSRQTINLRPMMSVNAFDVGEMMSDQEHPMLRVSYTVPKVYSHDYNGDGKIDLLVSFRDEILIFAETGDQFTHDPVKRYRIRLFPDEQADRGRGGPPINIDFEDLDGDGKVDILANEIVGRPGSLKSRTVLFWGKSDGINRGRPDIEFKTQYPVFGAPLVMDVNKDGRLDLIMAVYNLNALSVGKAILTGEVTLEWAYFLQRPDRSYSNTPDRTTSTELKFDLKKLRLESGIPNIVGDFNGDGLPDQAVGEDENTLVVTLRDMDGNELGAKERINVPVSIVNRVVDLNRDGRSDFLIHYHEDPDRVGEFRILMNIGPW